MTQQTINELKQFLSIPSISTDPIYQKEIEKCSLFLMNHCQKIGLKPTKIKTPGHPCIYAESNQNKDWPTILFYGHYDVQPPDPLNQWETPPFTPSIRNGYIYARGASDDKGQVWAHLKAIEKCLKEKIKINIKVLIEGEEEIGSPNLTKILIDNQKKLNCDHLFISDTPMFNKDQPSICISLRGLLCAEISLTGPKQDLHSGQHGGCVANPINGLATLIHSLKDEKNKITIPNFYNEIEKLHTRIQKSLNQLKFNKKNYQKELGITQSIGEEKTSILQQRWFRPTLDCNGIIGGYTQEGSKTIIPNSASTKISMRLVSNQNPKKIAIEFKKHLKKHCPKGLKLNIKIQAEAPAYQANLNNPIYPIIEKTMKKVFNKQPVYIGEGGSIPIVSQFKKYLKKDSLLIGFNGPHDAIHSPNERFEIKKLTQGINFIVEFLKKIQK